MKKIPFRPTVPPTGNGDEGDALGGSQCLLHFVGGLYSVYRLECVI